MAEFEKIAPVEPIRILRVNAIRPFGYEYRSRERMPGGKKRPSNKSESTNKNESINEGIITAQKVDYKI